MVESFRSKSLHSCLYLRSSLRDKAGPSKKFSIVGRSDNADFFLFLLLDLVLTLLDFVVGMDEDDNDLARDALRGPKRFGMPDTGTILMLE